MEQFNHFCKTEGSKVKFLILRPDSGDSFREILVLTCTVPSLHLALIKRQKMEVRYMQVCRDLLYKFKALTISKTPKWLSSKNTNLRVRSLSFRKQSLKFIVVSSK